MTPRIRSYNTCPRVTCPNEYLALSDFFLSIFTFWIIIHSNLEKRILNGYTNVQLKIGGSATADDFDMGHISILYDL